MGCSQSKEPDDPWLLCLSGEAGCRPAWLQQHAQLATCRPALLMLRAWNAVCRRPALPTALKPALHPRCSGRLPSPLTPQWLLFQLDQTRLAQ